MSPRTFLITGVSSGFGRAFAQRAVAAGHRVVGTVRSTDAAAAFEQLAPGHTFARVLDITHDDEVEAVTAAIEHDIAPIDVLIANAGYGHEGTFEESSMADLREQFAVNVFGTVAVMKAVVPGMRQRRRGHIIVITSVGGLVPSPTLSFYNGSKFAMEGITRSLAPEVARFGIHVTAVEPGAFRTDWSGRSLRRAARSITDYDELLDPISAARAGFNGKQPGDPAKAGDAILQLIDADEPPTHLLLGSDAASSITRALDQYASEVDQWRELTHSTDFDAPATSPSTPATTTN
jgi:NAD(P)-dependent dehydrogenase (short-subunit alcohol dehydrogenase family)